MLFGSWPSTAAQMSAPRLVLPFLLGVTQVVPRRAMLLGLVVTQLLGQRWRVRRSALSAVLVVGALCLEPLARVAVGRLFEPTTVWITEVAFGAVVTVYFAGRLVAYRRARTAVA